MGLELGPAIRKSKGQDVTAVVNLDGGATITLRYMDPEDMRDLKRQAYRATLDPDKKQFDAFNEKKQFDLLLVDKAVVGFAGMLVDGTEVPYTQENARMLILHSFIFGAAVHNNVADIQHFVERKKEAERAHAKKN